jgi:hypothetical protein
MIRMTNNLIYDYVDVYGKKWYSYYFLLDIYYYPYSTYTAGNSLGKIVVVLIEQYGLWYYYYSHYINGTDKARIYNYGMIY